jgi:hypothetical protein
MFGGVCLGGAELLGGDHVELEMMAVHSEEGTDEVRPFVESVGGGNQRG